ncbi:hypothetical protein BZB76_4172 [Actinomadura pelletieri DSM 43383]|uniref:Uncharacterized protein n=1 Tax=Actinomadura pelletieri DSM 43383 TaxID=1120940 RepID=A0A495QLM7_9ACTN|nr:hypothetical protein [Actinomadura pelletieri]RKS73480.1 hypothetical protein BZB76_4172 [Actinomadura pelletieri DSM 43383]
MYRTHEMRKIRTEQSGREEWACPTCGRRMLLRWPPHYEKQVIEPGDERACHVGRAADEPATTPPAATGRPPTTARETGHRSAPESGEQAGRRQWRDARRWLRETGVYDMPAPPHGPAAAPSPTPASTPPPARTRLGPTTPL